MLKPKLELLIKEFTLLKQKITTKLQALQESNRKLELSEKENQANEQVLETLLKEFKELTEQLA